MGNFDRAGAGISNVLAKRSTSLSIASYARRLSRDCRPIHIIATGRVDDPLYFSYTVCHMSAEPTLGTFEQLVLAAVLALGDDAYGVSIHAMTEALSQPKRPSLGAVYATLDRLEDKGLLGSWLSNPTPERGGRAKRFYRLEDAGKRALREAAGTAQRIIDVVHQHLGGDLGFVAH